MKGGIMKFFFSMITFLLLMQNTFTQVPDTLWTRTYGGIHDAWGNDVQQTSDGGYIIVGCIPDIMYWNIWLIKTNADGDTLWTKSFGGKLDDYGYAVQQTTDGGYIIIGETDSFGQGYGHPYLWLIKTNANGDTLWTKTYNGMGIASGNSVQQTEDGGYIITGGTGVSEAYDRVLLIRTNSKGDSLWTRIYGDSGTAKGKFVRQATDGGYILACDYDYRSLLIKTDESADTLWTKTFRGGAVGWQAYSGSVQQTADEGYIFVGSFDMWPSRSDAFLAKMNSDGDTQWMRRYSINNWGSGSAVQQTADGGYIFAGSRIFRTDADGDTLWTRDYGGMDGGDESSIQKTSDCGYIITGVKYHIDGNLNQMQDLWLIKIAPDEGMVPIKVSDTNIPGFFNLIQSHPNPFNPATTIEYNLPKSSHIRIFIYDILGRQVKILVDTRQSAGHYQTAWDGTDDRSLSVAAGLYFCRMEAGDFVKVMKLVLVR
jgi:hypothetical protein